MKFIAKMKKSLQLYQSHSDNLSKSEFKTYSRLQNVNLIPHDTVITSLKSSAH